MADFSLDPGSLYVLAVIFLATLVRATLGFGEALIAVPLLAFRLPVAVAAPLSVLVSVAVAGVIVAADWRRIEFRAARGLVLSSLFGIPFGLWLLAHAADGQVKILLGAMIVLFSGYALAAPRALHLAEDHAAWLLGCGFLAGVLGGAYGMNGPPLVVYGALRRWPPQRFRATLQGYFLPVSVCGLIGYLLVGFWSADVTRLFAMSLPAIAASLVLGHVINQRLSADRFLVSVHGGLIAIGVSLIVQAVLT